FGRGSFPCRGEDRAGRCFTFASRSKVYFQCRSVPTLSPISAANSSAVRPLSANRSTRLRHSSRLPLMVRSSLDHSFTHPLQRCQRRVRPNAYIVTHLETFPRERARAACLRAEHFGCYGYGTLKSILRRGLDLEPLLDA